MPATDPIPVRLRHHFYDEDGVFHPKGTVLVRSPDRLPGSAILLGEEEGASAPSGEAEVTPVDPADASPGDTLASLSKRKRKKKGGE